MNDRPARVGTVFLEAGLVGRDRATLCAFYTEVMGFELVERLEFDIGTVCKLRRDAARLKLFFPAPVDPVATFDPWFRPGGWRYATLSLPTHEEVDELVAAVAASAGRLLTTPTNHRPGARMAVVADPEGNVWELLAEGSAPATDTT